MTTLGLFARHPLPGKTKTRLAKNLGDEAAAGLADAFLRDLLRRMPEQANRFLLCATPESPESREWFQPHATGNVELQFQPEGGLGDRIDWFFHSAFEAVNGSTTEAVILIGSDSPDLPSVMISEATDRLQQTDIVFCPATDGGYTLVGMKSFHSRLFEGVEFGSPQTLSQSIDAVDAAGLKCQLQTPWYDIDEVQDLSLLRSRLRTDQGVRDSCPRTLEALKKCWPAVESVLRQSEE